MAMFTKILFLVALTLSLFIKPGSVLCASEVKCIESERQALLKFKQGVVDDGGYLSSWGSGEGEKECCEWNGVECSNITGNVIELSLSDYFLRVDNLDWLPRLSSLRYLDLTRNNLNETNNWLQQISKLSLLEELHLQQCQLPNTIPALDVFANSSLSSLTLLDLSGNNLSSFKIFGSLFNSSSLLTHIDLSGNTFNGPIPDSFGLLNLLEELSLQENMLNEIPFSLGNLTHLRNLYLTRNSFNQPVAQIFRNLSGRSSKSLDSIDLSFNQLVDSLPDITQFSSLKSLGLRNNQLSGIHPQSPAQPSSLVYLDLSNNKIGRSLQELSAFSSLEELFLSGNQIKGLPKSIWRLSKLKNLDLSSNSLKGTITEAHLSTLANLTELDLSNNSQLSLNISSDWSPPFQLNRLGLNDCNVGPGFPKWLQTQTSIGILDMTSTGISDVLPTWLWNMSLIVLKLSDNHIHGTIPSPSSNFGGIDYVYLNNNHLSGPIPLFLFHSTHLQLSENNLSGSISHLCKAATDHLDMEVLDLSDNQLTGELLDCYENASSLWVVNLANNNFSGQIPSTFGNMQELEIIHLRNNSFTGELPPSLKNCTQLRMLDVGGNKLTGTIPKWMGTHLTNLRVLSLQSNQFHGSIDTTICQLIAIQILDLSRNNLSGKIPKCFNSFTSLLQKNSSIDGIDFTRYPVFLQAFGNYYVDKILVQWKGHEFEYKNLGLLKGIDLSNNKLASTIPQELSDLRGLVFLNLSRNHLIGNIMSNIGHMEMLEWLDLSRNELSGAIPNSLAELHFLSVLNLSYNKLTGKIPLGTQLQSFNSSAYVGNSQLCGLPLVKCPWESPYPSSIDRGEGNNAEEDDGLINRDFYISLAFGFIIGFWMFVGTLFIKHSWRQSYFNFWNKIGDWMYVTSAISVARFKRKFLA